MKKTVKVRCPVCSGRHGLRLEQTMVGYLDCPYDKAVRRIRIAPKKQQAQQLELFGKK